MRTTFTASPDVADQIRAIAERTGHSLSRVVNDLLRAAIWAQPQDAPSAKYTAEAFPLGLRPGLDPERLSAYLADLDVTDHDRSGR